MRRKLRYAALLALSLAGVAAGAPSIGTGVVVRAKGERPTPALIEYVSRNAEPTRFNSEDHPEIALRTPRELIDRLCGSTRPEYVAEIENRFGIFGNLDLPLSDRAFQIEWPACLRVDDGPSGGFRYEAQAGETRSSLFKKFAGGWEAGESLDAYFGGDENRHLPRNADDLPKGTPVRIPFVTSFTPLKPVGVPSVSFAEGLKQAGSVDVVLRPESAGSIVVPPEARLPQGAIQSAGSQCSGSGEDYPYDAADVIEAYSFIRDERSQSPTYVPVLVLDNGFFGLPCTDQECPPVGANGSFLTNEDRFPGRFFRRVPYRPGFLVGETVQPIADPVNYRNRDDAGQLLRRNDVNLISGHGTHVAGLALGGPPRPADIANDSRPRNVGALFGPAGQSWLKIAIGNLAAGREYLLPKVEDDLTPLLTRIPGRKIVNMSVAFEKDRATEGKIRTAIELSPFNLFVVAAGNSGGGPNIGADLAEDGVDALPAEFGGGGLPNVVAVASVDADDKISLFSNFSGKMVDIAAPGCRLKSWLDADSDPVPMSGTSQAAPVVTFAAILLKSLSDGEPLRIKNRLMYSGSLLPDAAERRKIYSRSKLNIPQTLLFFRDIVRYERGGRIRTVLASVDEVQRIRCDGGAVPWDTVRAMKRGTTADRFTVFTTASDNRLSVCESGTSAAQVVLTVTHEIVGGRIGVAEAPGSMTLLPGELLEIVRAEADW